LPVDESRARNKRYVPIRFAALFKKFIALKLAGDADNMVFHKLTPEALAS